MEVALSFCRAGNRYRRSCDGVGVVCACVLGAGGDTHVIARVCVMCACAPVPGKRRHVD